MARNKIMCYFCGRFDGLLNTTNYLEADSSSTLGTLTFQQFQPRDLKVRPCIAYWS